MGLILVVIKFLLYLQVDVADLLYGVVLLLTLLITAGEVLEYKRFILNSRILDLVAGFLFPLDLYAVLVLLGVPLTN